ncbi:hypothetical protein FRC16_003005, partial [Serendipita sp. 398]
MTGNVDPTVSQDRSAPFAQICPPSRDTYNERISERASHNGRPSQDYPPPLSLWVIEEVIGPGISEMELAAPVCELKGPPSIASPWIAVHNLTYWRNMQYAILILTGAARDFHTEFRNGQIASAPRRPILTVQRISHYMLPRQLHDRSEHL